MIELVKIYLRSVYWLNAVENRRFPYENAFGSLTVLCCSQSELRGVPVRQKYYRVSILGSAEGTRSEMTAFANLPLAMPLR